MVQFSQWILVSNRKDLSLPWRDPAIDHVMRSVSSRSGQNGVSVSMDVTATDSRLGNLLVCIYWLSIYWRAKYMGESLQDYF